MNITRTVYRTLGIGPVEQRAAAVMTAMDLDFVLHTDNEGTTSLRKGDLIVIVPMDVMRYLLAHDMIYALRPTLH